MKYIRQIIFIVLILFLINLTPERSEGQVPVEYEIIGDTVYIDIAGKGKISQTPHTLLKSKNHPIINFTNNFGSELCLDIALGFDTERVRATSIEYWKEDVEHPYEVTDFGNIELYQDCAGEVFENYGLVNATTVWCNDAICLLNGTTEDCYWEINDYNRYATNTSGARVFYNVTAIIGSHTEYDYYDDWWTIPESKYSKVDYNDKEWYLFKDITFVNGETKTIRPEIYVNVGLGENSGKYDIIIKKCSETMSEAISSGDYVYLDPWWNSSWNKCRVLNLTNPASATLTGFPFLIELNATRDFPEAQPDGDDLRFINASDCDSDGNELPFEIETWNNTEASKLSHIWLKHTLTSNQEIQIALYYNSSASGIGQDAYNVWDSNYLGVWHMTRTDARDSTSNGYNFTTQNSPVYNESGLISNSVYFNKDDEDYIYIATGSGKFNVASNTIEAWVKIDTDPDTSAQGIWSYDYTSHNAPYYAQLFVVGGSAGNDELTCGWNLAGVLQLGMIGVNAFTNDMYKWKYVSMTWTSGSQAVYSDTILRDSETNSGSRTYYDQEVYVGHTNYGAYFDGHIDELRFSNIVRSKDWLNASHNITDNPSFYLEVGDEETPTANNVPSYTGFEPSNNTDLTAGTTSIILNVTVNDADGGDSLTVSFMDATDDSIICTNSSISPATEVSCEWTGLSDGMNKTWYVNVTDGTDTNTSGTYDFEVLTTCVLGIEWDSPTTNANHSLNTHIDYNVTVYATNSSGYGTCIVNASIDPTLTLNNETHDIFDDSTTYFTQQGYNYGGHTLIYILEGTTTEFLGFIKFNISEVPSDATINKATLMLYLDDNKMDANEDQIIRIYKIYQFPQYNISGYVWDEGNKSGTANDLVYEINYTNDPHDAVSGRYDNINYNITIYNTDTTGKYYNWTVTSFVDADKGNNNITFFINPSLNASQGIGSADYLAFGSKENADSGKFPKLVIEYTEATPERKTGLIPQCPDSDPFCTTDDNPHNQITISSGSSYTFNWTVNATGTEGNTFTFNATVDLYGDSSVTNITENINITIDDLTTATTVPWISFEYPTPADNNWTNNEDWFTINASFPSTTDYCFINYTPSANYSLGLVSDYENYYAKYYTSTDHFDFAKTGSDTEHLHVLVDPSGLTWSYWEVPISELWGLTVKDAQIEFRISEMSAENISENHRIQIRYNNTVGNNLSATYCDSNPEDCIRRIESTTLHETVYLDNASITEQPEAISNNGTIIASNITTLLQDAIDNQLDDFWLYFDGNFSDFNGSSVRIANDLSNHAELDGNFKMWYYEPRVRVVMDIDNLSMSLSSTQANFTLYNMTNGTNEYKVCCVNEIGQNCTDTRTMYLNISESTITPPASDTCTYGGSGNWNIDASDNCKLSAETVSGIVYCYGTGSMTFEGIIDANGIIIDPDCVWNTDDGGGFT